jgi:uncharacterized protein (DUF3084 family)
LLTGRGGPLARGPKRRTAAVVAIVVGLLVGSSALANAAVVSRSVLSGAVQTGKRPLSDSVVVLYAAGSTSPRRLGSAITGARGEFRITYLRPRGAAVLYLVATGGHRALRTLLRPHRT